jgi:hypothetical protein
MFDLALRQSMGNSAKSAQVGGAGLAEVRSQHRHPGSKASHGGDKSTRDDDAIALAGRQRWHQDAREREWKMKNHSSYAFDVAYVALAAEHYLAPPGHRQTESLL